MLQTDLIFKERNDLNYTKFVREYCQNNSGEIFDVSRLKNTEFVEVPYKTLLKILNRLTGEDLLTSVSRGVYFIGEKTVDEELIFDEYIDGGKGMFVGYKLFNDVGLADYDNGCIEVYTNNTSSIQKNIGKYHLTKVDLVFDDNIIDIIALLEIIDIGYAIKSFDFIAYQRTLEKLSHSYSDGLFCKVVEAIRYRYSTIKQLNDLLERNNVVNNCLEFFEAAYKNT